MDELFFITLVRLPGEMFRAIHQEPHARGVQLGGRLLGLKSNLIAIAIRWRPSLVETKQNEQEERSDIVCKLY